MYKYEYWCPIYFKLLSMDNKSEDVKSKDIDANLAYDSTKIRMWSSVLWHLWVRHSAETSCLHLQATKI
jgi:hypothetical protein